MKHIYRCFTNKHNKLSAALSYCMNSTKDSFNVQKFIDYMLGSKVQNDLVPKLGYISIDKMQVERDSNNHVVQK